MLFQMFSNTIGIEQGFVLVGRDVLVGVDVARLEADVQGLRVGVVRDGGDVGAVWGVGPVHDARVHLHGLAETVGASLARFSGLGRVIGWKRVLEALGLVPCPRRKRRQGTCGSAWRARKRGTTWPRLHKMAWLGENVNGGSE